MLDQEAAINMMYLMELSDDPAGAVQHFDDLNRYLIDHGCTFGDGPLPILLKPQFLSAQQVKHLEHVVKIICSALGKSRQRFVRFCLTFFF